VTQRHLPETWSSGLSAARSLDTDHKALSRTSSERGIRRDGTQEVVIPTDVIDGLVREGHPPLVSPAEKSLM
jgi:hypothetical protein